MGSLDDVETIFELAEHWLLPFVYVQSPLDTQEVFRDHVPPRHHNIINKKHKKVKYLCTGCVTKLLGLDLVTHWYDDDPRLTSENVHQILLCDTVDHEHLAELEGDFRGEDIL